MSLHPDLVFALLELVVELTLGESSNLRNMRLFFFHDLFQNVIGIVIHLKQWTLILPLFFMYRIRSTGGSIARSQLWSQEQLCLLRYIGWWLIGREILNPTSFVGASSFRLTSHSLVVAIWTQFWKHKLTFRRSLRVLGDRHPALPCLGICCGVKLWTPLILEHFVKIHSLNMLFKLILLFLMSFPISHCSDCGSNLSKLVKDLPISLIYS